ncbi:MAG: IS110 family transposase [Pseudomonadota bacterium]
MSKTLFIGLDVHKCSVSVAVAEDGRDGPIRFIGNIDNTAEAIGKMAMQLAKNGMHLEFCYEAGPCGYGVYRLLRAAGHGCSVVAPSRIPRAPGDRVKTDRRDAQRLAVLHRAGDLTAVWVPDQTHEAMRDLVRARWDAKIQLVTAKQQLLAFLLRHGRIYESGRKYWTLRHRHWLSRQAFDEAAHRIVFQDYVEAVWTADERCKSLVQRIRELLPAWSLGPTVEALRCVRGLDLISAVTFVASVGDLTRFETPRQLMAYLGLTPSERSSGGMVRRGRITKTGNREARRMLIEAAWSYRYPARLTQHKSDALIAQPKRIRDLAWKAQERLCRRFARLLAGGKKSVVVVTAIARELAGFVWAVGQELKRQTHAA